MPWIILFLQIFLLNFNALLPNGQQSWLITQDVSEKTYELVIKIASRQLAMWRPNEGQTQLITVIPRSAPRLRPNAIGLTVGAVAGTAIDALSGEKLFIQKETEVRPIASITKLMTALVFLDHNPGWDKVYKVQASDQRDGGRVSFFEGDEVKVRDLFSSMLVASDNAAVVALVHSTGLSLTEFVDKMNERAKRLGLNNTSFADPTGLDNRNVSTVYEVTLLAREAWLRPEIQETALLDNYSFKTMQGDTRRIVSTDNLLADRGDYLRIQGGKTGYLDAAGYCIVGQFSKDGRVVIGAVLGAPTKEARFREVRRMAEWVYNNYRWVN